MCHPIPIARTLHPAIPNSCTAKTLGAGTRLTIGVQALAGQSSVTDLAHQHEVSRKFVYQQAVTAQSALDDAVTTARSFNNQQQLADIRIAAVDEVFPGPPILVGADVASTYCFLLSSECRSDTGGSCTIGDGEEETGLGDGLVSPRPLAYPVRRSHFRQLTTPRHARAGRLKRRPSRRNRGGRQGARRKSDNKENLHDDPSVAQQVF